MWRKGSVSYTFAIVVSVVIGIVGCKNEISTPSSSRITGHFKVFTSDELSSYSGKMQIIPEYRAQQNILVGDSIFLMQGYEILEAALLSGVNKIYVVSGQIASNSNPTQEELKIALWNIALQHLAAKGVDVNSVQVKESMQKIFASIEVVQNRGYYYNLRPSNLASQEKNMSVWARDWAPWSAELSANPQAKIMLDMNYYPSRQWDDSVSIWIKNHLTIVGNQLARVNLPIYIEGGNFMNTPSICMMSNSVIEANSKSHFNEEDQIYSSGSISTDYVYSGQDLINTFNTYGCAATEIVEKLPYEGTGHIDMWAKFLDDNTVMIGDLSDESIALAKTPQALALIPYSNIGMDAYLSQLYAIKSHLQKYQQLFSQKGYRVIKVPMPLNLPVGENSYLTRSYTNSLIIDTGYSKAILVPQYKKYRTSESSLSQASAYPDESLLPKYELEVSEALVREGFKVQFVETDYLISRGGSVHCSIMQVAW